jgi:hypothetical protein
LAQPNRKKSKERRDQEAELNDEANQIEVEEEEGKKEFGRENP